jgi:hypothetical protein
MTIEELIRGKASIQRVKIKQSRHLDNFPSTLANRTISPGLCRVEHGLTPTGELSFRFLFVSTISQFKFHEFRLGSSAVFRSGYPRPRKLPIPDGPHSQNKFEAQEPKDYCFYLPSNYAQLQENSIHQYMMVTNVSGVRTNGVQISDPCGPCLAL